MIKMFVSLPDKPFLKQPKPMNDSKRDYNSIVLFLTAALIIILMTHSKRKQYSMSKVPFEYGKTLEKGK